MQVETPFNSIICTLWDLGNYNKKTFCNLFKARFRAGWWGFCVCVKKVFSQPQKIQQLTCVCFALRYSWNCGCPAEMPQNACGCWSAILRAFMSSGLHSFWFKRIYFWDCSSAAQTYHLKCVVGCQQVFASLEILACISWNGILVAWMSPNGLSNNKHHSV